MSQLPAQTATASSNSLWRSLRATLEMIKFEHSVFALPFALTGALLAWREGGFDAQGAGWKLLWITAAMIGARSAAMTFNRILDADIDAKNPRTRLRHLPSGTLTRGLVFSGQLLLDLAAKGVLREQAYLWVQRNAMRAWENGEDFRKLVAADADIARTLTAAELDAAFDLKRQLRHVDAIFDRVFRN